MRRLLPLALLLIFSSPVLADEKPLDVVTLYNGHKVQGRVVEANENEVVLQMIGRSGGEAKFTIPRSDVRRIEYGEGETPSTSTAAPDQVRDSWFLLRSEGRIIGTRHLEMWSLTGDERGFRFVDEIVYFPQGRHVPEIRIRLVEWTDLRFILRKGLYREVGEGSRQDGGPARYVRSVSGHVEDGRFKVGVTEAGETTQREVEVPAGTRGRLGFREHLLRRERTVGIDLDTILDVAQASLVDVRAGFVSVGDRELCPPAPGAPIAVRRDELHWEEAGTRLISWFDASTAPHEEAITDSTSALRATKERADAAAENSGVRAKDPEANTIKLPEAGVQFTLPDPSWTWRPQTARPTHTGWRVLGLGEAPVYTANVRVELHPEGARAAPGITSARAWLLERLKSVASDLKVFEDVTELTDIPGGWRIGVAGTLRGDTLIRTLAVVIDRDDARVVLLVACPERSWIDGGRDAMERFVASVQLL